MTLFSEREGLKPTKSAIQVDSLDSDLRNGLWNVLAAFYWDRVKYKTVSSSLSYYDDMHGLFTRIWANYFKRPIDTMHDYWPDTYKEIRDYFFGCQWYEVYDFIEFVVDNYRDLYNQVNRDFILFCNSVLEREVSAFRFVGGKITRITSEEEIAEIELALQAPSGLKAVTRHLKIGLDKLSDRESPDYANSIKESISAVEAMCNLITANAKGTLGQALKELERRVAIHPALKSGFEKLYGYTSDAEGIRHALLEEPNLSFEDAKFMLVSCSAFVNYLVTKSSKAGIKL
jgi:hypothetical protein